MSSALGPLSIDPDTRCDAFDTSQKVSGVVLVTAARVKGARANHWQYSTDGGKSWVDVPPTTKAATSLPGLQPGLSVQIRHRVLTTTGLSDWGQSVAHFVS